MDFIFLISIFLNKHLWTFVVFNVKLLFISEKDIEAPAAWVL